MAQALRNGRMDRAEKAIQKAGETILALADIRKRIDEKLAALDVTFARWYERHGDGSGGQIPS
jgi:hypothetical protein